MRKWINSVLCLLVVFFCCATAEASALDTANLTVSGNTVTIGAEEDTVLKALHQAGKTAKIAVPFERQETLSVAKDGSEIVAAEPEWLEKDGVSYIRFPVTGAGQYLIYDRCLQLPEELEGENTVWIDGVPCSVEKDSAGAAYVELSDIRASTMVLYSGCDGESNDVHTQYPTGMKVWMLTFGENGYAATEVPELEDILQYSGCSIRVEGKKGVRMITSMKQEKKNALTSAGLAGYTLKEYGTVVAWANQLDDDHPLVLGAPYVKSNYAFRENYADPVFQYTGDLMQYTNVLVNFSNAQCKKDISMRSYMILKDLDGRELTLYGGTVTRSVILPIRTGMSSILSPRPTSIFGISFTTSMARMECPSWHNETKHPLP